LGAAHAPTIATVSNDIAIDPAAELGLRGLTNDITPTSGAGASRTVIGGGVTGDSGDYTLDQDEAARLFADDSIEIVSPGAIAVGDLTLAFGTAGNIGTGGTLEVTSPTTISII